MPLATGKISWRSNTSNKTNNALLAAIRTFLVNSGNYTVITDQITASSYFVVQSTRDTGFVGDKIVAQIGAGTWADGGITFSWLYIIPWESWSGTTGTNCGITYSPRANIVPIPSNYHAGIVDHTHFSTVFDSDIFISCDDTFILTASHVSTTTDLTRMGSNINGVACFQRLSGDNDPGTFYGHIGGEQSSDHYRIYVPRRFDGATGTSAFFNLNTKIGSTQGASGITTFGINESGKHTIFDIGVHLASSNKFKGKLFGLNFTTYGPDFGFGTLLPSSASPQYLVCKPSQNSLFGGIYFFLHNPLMQVAPTITNIVT